MLGLSIDIDLPRDEITRDLIMNERKALKKIANLVIRIWKEEADISLSSSRVIYQKSIGKPEYVGGGVIIRLSNWLPQAVEEGVPRFNMKLGLLGSSNVKVSKSGNRYISIPIRGKKKYARVHFRTVSDKSPDDSWIHPGIKAQHLIDRVEERLKHFRL